MIHFNKSFSVFSLFLLLVHFRLQTNKSHLLQQIPPQQHQQLHSVPQQGVHVMAGYTAAAYPSTSPVMNMQQQPSFNVTPFTGVSQHQVTASKYPVAVVGQLAEVCVLSFFFFCCLFDCFLSVLFNTVKCYIIKTSF